MVGKFCGSTLGLFSSKHLWVDPEGIKTNGGFGRQVEEFSRHFKKIILVVPFEEFSVPKLGYVIHIQNMEVISLPYHSGDGLHGKLDSLIKAPLMLSRVLSAYNQCDVLSYWLSGYVGTLGLLIHKIKHNKPGFVYLGTDWPERIRQSRNTWYRRSMAGMIEVIMPWLVRDVPMFAVGELSQKYGHANPFAHADVQTTLSLTDIRKNVVETFYKPLHLLFVGRLAVEKGLNYLVEAVSLCKKDGIELDLTIVGDGDERKDLENLVHEQGLGDHVHFKGFVPLGDAMQKIYRQADVFILPSTSEGMPKVLIEALANGLVVIASQVGGIPTLIQNGVNGLLVESRSPSSIAAAIQKILMNPSNHKKMAQNGLATAMKYTIEERTQQLISQLGDDFSALGWK